MMRRPYANTEDSNTVPLRLRTPVRKHGRQHTVPLRLRTPYANTKDSTVPPRLRTPVTPVRKPRKAAPVDAAGVHPYVPPEAARATHMTIECIGAAGIAIPAACALVLGDAAYGSRVRSGRSPHANTTLNRMTKR